jgi:hypothetical protein
MKRLVFLSVVLLFVLGGQLNAAPILWLGNDTLGDVFQTDTSGTVLQQIPDIDVTGIAFDGSNLYFADRPGNYSVRTPDGLTVLDTFTAPSGGTGEDLAWDTSRNRLWRVVHNNDLQKVDPVSGTVEAMFALPTSHPLFTTLGGLGVAYDGNRDLLYVSYCERGCAPVSLGLVQIVDPATGLVTGDLFTTSGFMTGGLGYDPVSDSLWVGDSTTVRNIDLTGNVLSSFARPSPGGFVDGLEFIGVPEPSTLALMGFGLMALGFINRRRSGN